VARGDGALVLAILQSGLQAADVGPRGRIRLIAVVDAAPSAVVQPITAARDGEALLERLPVNLDAVIPPIA